MVASKELRAELGLTVNLIGANWGPEMIPMVLKDLAIYPELLVIAALQRCRRELKFKLTPSDIIERIDDGRPAPDEAWAQVSAGLDERATVVATDEALEALAEVRGLAGDHNAVRMGFREVYKRIALRNKAAGIFTKWVPSLGHDPEQREVALRAAAAAGRLDLSSIVGLLRSPDPIPEAQKFLPGHAAADNETPFMRHVKTCQRCQKEDVGCEAGELLPTPDERQDFGLRRVTWILFRLGQGLRADRRQQRDREPRFDWAAEDERLQRQRTEAA